MLSILNSLNAHKFPKFQPILMILVSKIMVHRAFSDKTYLLLLWWLFPLTDFKLIFLFLNQNICCGYSKNGSFEHPKHMLKLMGKKILTILRSKIVLI